MKRQLFAAACLLLMINATAQDPWVLPGNSSTDPSTDFVGTTDNEELVFRTDDLFRFRLNKTETYGTLGGFTSIPANGFGLITPSSSFIGNGPGPFSLFHLADGTGDNVQSLGYRPWMRVGLSVTGNGDQGYLGHKYTYEDPLDHESGELEDYTDMVIQWSDNPGKWLKDRMRFIFTSAYDESNTGAGSLEGLEAIRLWPKDDSEVNVGLGDFHAGNFADPTNVVEPTERLDVLNGRVRIRQLPDDDACEEDYLVMVVDASSDPDERGVVKWVDPSVLTGAPDCDWTMDAPTNLMWTATAGIGTTANCPELDWRVGIGTSQPNYKLHVKHDNDNVGLTGGIAGVLEAGPTGAPQGVYGEVLPNDGTLLQPVGVKGKVSHVTENGQGVYGEAWAASGSTYKIFGTLGLATGSASGTLDQGYGSAGFCSSPSGSTITTASGVYGELQSAGETTYGAAVSAYAWGAGASTRRSAFDGYCTGGGAAANSYGARLYALGATTNNHGVYAEAQGAGVTNYGVKASAPSTGATFNAAVHAYAPVQTDSWSIWSAGDEMSTSSTPWSTSDENLKQNIEDFSGGLNHILQLQPKTYNFRTEEFDYMSLPQGTQFGLMAQNLEAVLPELVRTVRRPADVDSLGSVVHAELEFKAVHYGSLIPILISAVKEMNAHVAAMQDEVEELQQELAATQAQVANCCAPPSGGGQLQQQGTGSRGSGDDPLTPAQERLLRIAPNPFTDRTTLYCTLERAGRMQLMANSSDGRDLRMLSEGQREAGEFQYEWSTEHLAPGVYYVTLLLDGEPVVKRAVKVGR